MKKLILCLFFFSNLAFAGKGLVITHEAPLLPKPSFDTRPVQHVRKGNVIYIHDKHFGLADYQVTFTGYIDQDSPDFNKVEDGVDKEGFFQTLDKTGQIAYIEKKYVKLIFKDEREKKSALVPWKHDPTDYRLEEPLPRNYPLYTVTGMKASAALAFGPARKINYPFTSDIVRETYSGRMGGEFTFARKVAFDQYDRFYFGGMGHVYTAFNEFFLENGVQAEEFYAELGAGPMLAYYFYRGDNWGASLNSGITINWQRIVVSQSGAGSEERIYSGFIFTPKFQLLVTRSNLVPEIDLLLGANFQFNIDTNLTSGQTIVNENLWQENDAYTVPTGGAMSLFIGVHSSY